MWMPNSNVILCPTGGGHPDVDRIRSVHLHDLTIVLPYLYVIPLWLNTIPYNYIVRISFLCFSLSNFVYTICYMNLIFNFNSYSKLFHIVEIFIVTCTCLTTVIHYIRV